MNVTPFNGERSGKASGLRRVRAAGFEVPRFHVLDDEHFRAHLAHAGVELAALQRAVEEAAHVEPHRQTALFATSAGLLRDRIIGTTLSLSTKEAIDATLSDLGTDSVAVRSDMAGEDSAAFSFAGQLDSYLFVERQAVQDAVVRCWASAFSDRAVLYAMRSGAPPEAVQMSVVVQEMVDADMAGVAFSIDPSTGREECVIAAAWGLGEGVVAGTVDSDEYRWSAGRGETNSQVVIKHARVAQRPTGGTEIVTVREDLQSQRVLTREQVGAVGAMCRQLHDYFTVPVDVEWCFKNGHLFVLQARPVTTKPTDRSALELMRSYDNSNIQESFNGYTTPLTFSFASHAYQRVFMDFVRCVGVSKTRQSEFEMASRSMLAYLRGRVYYNLSSWYQMLALLPGYETNRRETEKVMWHLERTGEPVAIRQEGAVDRARKAWVGLNIATRFLLLRFTIPRFVDRFNSLYRSVDRQAVAGASLDELQETLKVIHQGMLNDWRIPNINDLRVMMFCGRLRRIVEEANGSGAQANVADLLLSIDGIESLRPTQEIRSIADRIKADTALWPLFSDDRIDARTLLDRLMGSPVGADIAAYTERYGDRCAGELKLETVTVRDRPESLIAMISAHLSASRRLSSGSAGKERYLAARRQLKAAVPFWRRCGLDSNIRLARQAVADRERLRLLRTKMFGIARAVYRAQGERLHERGVLDEPLDIYYLTVDEIAAYCEARAVSVQLREIVAARKAEHAGYVDAELPNRIDTRGIPYFSDLGGLGGPGTDEMQDPNASVLVGLGCATGVIEAPATVVHDPQNASVLNTIICAVRTDPGWAPLFPGAVGLVVERGSTLSHSAVIARELGLPTVVGVADATRIIRNGEVIRVDGDRGQVRRLSPNRGGLNHGL